MKAMMHVVATLFGGIALGAGCVLAWAVPAILKQAAMRSPFSLSETGEEPSSVLAYLMEWALLSTAVGYGLLILGISLVFIAWWLRKHVACAD
jgi:hypothetical protein